MFAKSNGNSNSGQEKEARLVECDCTFESFKDLERVNSEREGGYSIKCVKRSSLLVRNEKENYESKLEKFYISLDPNISLILNILEEDWVEHLLKVDESRWVSSQTSLGSSNSHPDTYTTMVSRTRKSSSVIFEHFEDEVISKIEGRVCLVAGIDVKYLEKLVMVRYRPGDYFKEHHDGAFRSHTILLYLNDCDGGETVFPRIGLAVRPIGNSGVFWRNITECDAMDDRLIHAGTSPRSGTKYVVNCFFNREPIRLM